MHISIRQQPRAECQPAWAKPPKEIYKICATFPDKVLLTPCNARLKYPNAMTIQHTLQTGLDALGQQTGARFTLDANGWSTLRYDKRTEITLGGDTALGLIFMLAPVCSLSDDTRARLMQEGLEMALLGLGTGGCTLGYDRANDQLVLSVSYPEAEMDGPGFVNRFSRFLEVVLRLKTAFEALAVEPIDGLQTAPTLNDFLPHPLMKV